MKPWRRNRKAVIFFLCLLFCFLLQTGGGFLWYRHRILSERVSQMADVCHMLGDSISQETITLNETGEEASLTEDFLTRTADASGYILWIIDTDNQILFSSDSASGTIPFTPLISRSYIKGNFGGLLKQDCITVFSSIVPENAVQPSGYVLLHYRYSDLTNSAQKMLWIPVLISAVSCFLIAAVFLLIRYRILCSYQNSLSDIRNYASEQNISGLPVYDPDERKSLLLSVRELLSELSGIKDRERELIGNVSHDLRTPLTTIKGYLEAIQDGTIPPELQGKYLGIVLSETGRLTEMTKNLLELNSLEYNRKELNLTSFSINTVIRKLLLSFEQRCLQNSIRFRLIFEEEELYVHADLLKIQQVLYNLIDNAVKFSPDHSVITISVKNAYGKILVSIKDEGPGIAPENLDRIWERFFKTDPSRGKDRHGSGLGLPIVKNIINLHQESIRVISEPGKGCEFLFTLKRSTSV